MQRLLLPAAQEPFLPDSFLNLPHLKVPAVASACDQRQETNSLLIERGALIDVSADVRYGVRIVGWGLDAFGWGSKIVRKESSSLVLLLQCSPALR
jgi:hypothetical protein